MLNLPLHSGWGGLLQTLTRISTFLAFLWSLPIGPWLVSLSTLTTTSKCFITHKVTPLPHIPYIGAIRAIYCSIPVMRVIPLCFSYSWLACCLPGPFWVELLSSWSPAVLLQKGSSFLIPGLCICQCCISEASHKCVPHVCVCSLLEHINFVVLWPLPV